MERIKPPLSNSLRQQAEDILKSRFPITELPLSEDETLKLIHELRVGQIELELKNKELMQDKWPNTLHKNGQNKILDLIDFEEVNKLLEGFNQTTGFVTAILDLDGNVLSKSGWRQICTQFHRINPETLKNCTKSDTVLANELGQSGKYHFYECLNGLIDVAVPIIINGEHIANLFSGQFFFDEPNLLFFKKQAKVHGFNEQNYLKALENVPVVSKEKVKVAMDFLLDMTQLISEITYQKLEQVQLNEALTKNEERYRLISDVASDYIFTSEVDKNGKLGLSWVTGAFERITGYSFDEYIARGGWRAALHPDDIEKDIQDFEELNKNNKVISDVRTFAKDGRIVWVRVYAHPVWDHQNNELIGIYGGVKDVTESKLAENALANSEARLHTLVQTIPDLIWLKDINGVYLSCNAVFERLYNAKEAEIIGKTDYDFVDRELADFFRANDLKAIALGKPSINEEWLTFADDGHTALIETTKTPMYSSSGELLGVLGIGHDITKRKQIEVALKESNERLNVILENNPIAIWDWDIKADKWFATQSYYTMLGYEPESNYPDRTVWLNRIHPDDREYVRIKISNILNNTDNQYSYEARILHADGSYRWQTVLGKAIDLDENGNVSHMIGVRIDTDNRKQAEQELIKAKERAEESDRLKTAFLSNMSHEIRTPLNSIIGFSDLLLDPFFGPKQQIEFVNAIKQSGNNLVAIISDIMDISRIETGQITIRNDQFSVTQLIQNIGYEQSYLIMEKGLELKLSKPDQDLLIIGDEGRIKQILLNFISNALKFTKKGFIEIGCSFRLNAVHFYVKDTGIGISKEFHEKIFERFRQIETAHTRKYGGNGLGLAISKQLAELMGGKVSIESEPGKGSTFYLSLPLI